MPWKWIAAASFGLTCAAGLGAAFAMRRWQRETDTVVHRIIENGHSMPASLYDAREVAHLPAPVVRYFQHVLRDGQPFIARARIVHEGTFNASTDRDHWWPFESVETFTTRPPAFVWSARVDMFGVPVVVRDSYMAGEGRTHAALFGLIPLARAGGTREIAEAALQRYLAEAPWFPTALLPSNGVTWSAIDDHRALATLSDGSAPGRPAVSVSLEFRFDGNGDVAEVYAPGRFRQDGNAVLATPWSGLNQDFSECGGVRIPTAAEVRWLLPDRVRPYWRGRVLDVEYEVTPAEDAALR